MLRDACLGACQSGRSCQVPLPRTRRLHLSLCRRDARERGKNCRSRSGADWLFNVERSSQCKVQEARGGVYIHILCASGCSIEEAALRSSSRGVTRCFGRIGFSLFIFFGVTRSDFGKSSSRRRPGRASGRCSSQTPTRLLSESKNGGKNKTRKIIK